MTGHCKRQCTNRERSQLGNWKENQEGSRREDWRGSWKKKQICWTIPANRKKMCVQSLRRRSFVCSFRERDSDSYRFRYLQRDLKRFRELQRDSESCREMPSVHSFLQSQCESMCDLDCLIAVSLDAVSLPFVSFFYLASTMASVKKPFSLRKDWTTIALFSKRLLLLL